MDLGLSGRVYVATGSSTGLGLATARCLVADGAHVIVTGRTEQRLHAAVAMLTDLGGESGGTATGIVLDNADARAPERLVEVAQSKYGRLDGALLSVGGPPTGSAAEVTDDAWRQSFEAVFLGAVRLARTIGRELRPGGAIALVLSGSVRAPITDLAISNGLRPGLAGFAKNLADEYGPRGVRVLSLLPAGIDTDRLRAVHSRATDPAAAVAKVAEATPLRRLGDPEEFGRVAAFFLSPAAGYVTGVAIPVDGGAGRTI